MTDYSKMSDFEINGRVARATQRIGDSTQARGKTFIHEHEDVGEFKNICIGWKEYDPCNNPTDAWPIIVENSISVIMHDEYKGQPWFACKGRINATHVNPLRAAMIVFLMMKEKDNV